jgi:hypothetical protein
MASEQRAPSRRLGRRWLFGLAALATGLVIAVPLAWASHQFTDVPNSNPFHNEISNLAGAGITAGKTCVPPGTPPTFCPEEPVVRQAMAAFLNRGLGRASNGTDIDELIGDTTVELGNVTIDVGGAPGGTQFVKVDAVIETYIESTTGCPCSTQFAIFQDGVVAPVSNDHFNTNDSVSAEAGFGDETGALTTVVAVPTGTTQTFRVGAVRAEPAPADGTVGGYASMTATTAAFGSTGSSTLGGKLADGRRSAGMKGWNKP